MKTRIVKSSGGAFWVGQIYITSDIYLLGQYLGERTGWETVTGICYTKWGAKRELKKWKKEHCGEEFEI